MENYNISAVVSKIIGYTEPCGDSRVDDTRYCNQEELIILTTDCIETLIDNSKFSDRQEYSMQRIGRKAKYILLEFKRLLDELELEA